jgi:hypothetical protein
LKKINIPIERRINSHGENTVILGNSWYQAFMQQHDCLIKRQRGKVKDINRLTWCTREEFSAMYDQVYEAMATSGIAIVHEVPVFRDKIGCDTSSENALGSESKYELTDPEY